ncbi:MAG: hypothetical protein PWQ82_113 [Thermosediminibacterales bacterium]|nr:hypothetical protein [Thermosediminibacterales bacterium]MDK2836420.1 hypothetical protein [Thermosediminibacterales bacterium]
MDVKNDIREGNLVKITFTLAWPAILEMMLHTMIWVVDTAMVGRLGAVALSAVGLGSEILFSVVFIFAAVGVGATAIIARNVGAQNYQRATFVAEQALVLSLSLGVVLAAFGLFLIDDIFKAINIEPAVADLALDYLGIILWALIFMLPMFVSVAIMRGTGNNKTPLVIAGITNFLNLIGDYVLIFGKFGAPAMGVKGAALAAAIGNITGSLIALYFIFSHREIIKIKPKNLLRFDLSIFKQIIKLSFPAGLEEGINNTSRILFVIMVANMGPVFFAAHQVAVAVESLSFMPGHGFAIAATIIVGQNLGAKNFDRSEKGALTAMKLGLLTMSFMGIVFLVGHNYIVRLFITDAKVAYWGALCIFIASFEQPFLAFYMTLSGALRGAGDTRWPMYAASIGNWLIRLPLVYMVVYIWKLSVTAIWIITTVDFALRSLVVFLRFRKGKWKEIDI